MHSTWRPVNVHQYRSAPTDKQPCQAGSPTCWPKRAGGWSPPSGRSRRSATAVHSSSSSATMDRDRTSPAWPRRVKPPDHVECTVTCGDFASKCIRFFRFMRGHRRALRADPADPVPEPRVGGHGRRFPHGLALLARELPLARACDRRPVSTPVESTLAAGPMPELAIRCSRVAGG